MGKRISVRLALAALLLSACSGSGLVQRQAAAPTPVPAQIHLSGLQSGACIRFPPTAGSTGDTIFIDPGHGGPDSGAAGSLNRHDVLEKDATLAVAIQLTALLRARGDVVVMARTTDSFVGQVPPSSDGYLDPAAIHQDMIMRIACANAAKADVLVSIHFDGNDNPSVGGTKTIYDAQRPFATANQRLAADLQSAMVAALGSPDDGVLTDDQLGSAFTSTAVAYGHIMELGPPSTGWNDAPTLMPGALVEALYVSNPQEAAVASAAAGQREIAQALAAGLKKYFDEERNRPASGARPASPLPS